MWFSSRQVLLLFARSLLLGVCFGALYDIFRILRIARKPRGQAWSRRRFLRCGDAALCAAGDILFWLICAVVYSIFIYWACGGRLRIVSLLALAGGFLCWFFTAGKLVVALADRIIALVRAGFRLAARFTLIPLYRLARLVFGGLCGLAYALFLRIYNRRARKRELALAGKGFKLTKGM